MLVLEQKKSNPFTQLITILKKTASKYTTNLKLPKLFVYFYNIIFP